ncbi:MAG TPA: HEPN domain-containing protein [Anaerolineae bacterium]|nr:HEPN domain-containing protein [Anaerolineae bacterium]
MNVLTIEWVEKADGDFVTAGRELRARRHPNYDAVCFHAQQVAEKYLKSFLQEHNRTFPKTHNLIELLELCLVVDPDFETQRNLLIVLDRYAVRYRYPGDTADKDEARDAYRTAKVLRAFLRNKLGFDDQAIA